MAKYTQITHKRTQSRLHRRYDNEITRLQDLGFQHLAYCMEDHGPYSAITLFRIIPSALSNGEILVIRWPFRLASANILLSTENPPSIALCMGMGTKIYSMFSDGTMIISSDFMSRAVPSPESKINRLAPHSTLEQTWSFHKAEVLRRSRALEFLSEGMTFGDYVLMSAFEEDPSQYVFS